MNSSYEKRFRASVAFGWIHAGLRLLSGLFLVGYSVRRLSREEWGLVVFANGIVSILGLIESGAALGIAKRLNGYFTRQQGEESRSYFSASVATCLAISLSIMTGALLVCMSLSATTAGVPAEYLSEARGVLLVVSLASALTALNFPYSACLQAVHRMDIDAKLNIAALLIRCGLTVILFTFVKVNALVYSSTFLAGTAVVTIGQRWWVQKNIPEARAQLRTLRLSQVKSVVGFNLLTMFSTINYTLFIQGPLILLQAKASPSSLITVGLYGMGLQFLFIVNAFAMVPSRSFSPVMISLIASRQTEAARQVYTTLTRMYTIAAILIAVATSYWGPSILLAWYGQRCLELLNAVPWLALATACGVAALPSAEALIALELLRIPGLIGLCLVSVALAAVWTHTSGSSVSDVKWLFQALALTYGLYQLMRISAVVSKLGISLVDALVKWLCPVAFAASLATMLGRALYRPSLTVHDFRFWLTLLCFVLLTVGTSWFVVFDRFDRKFIIKRIPGRRQT